MGENCFLRRNIAEFLGTFTIVFTGCGAVMVEQRFPGSVPVLGIPLLFGLVVSGMIYTLGHISGGHFNPAVTVAFGTIKKFPWKEAPYYIASQCLAAFAAIFLLKILLPAGPGYGSTSPHGVSAMQAFAWEVLMTFILMLVVMGVATDSRSQGALAGLVIGATVSLVVIVGGPLTGASLNPARSLAPNLFEGRGEFLWIYLLAPTLGAVLAGVLYEWMRNVNELGEVA